MIYTVTLNPALDYVLKVGLLSSDDINRAESEAIYYGGKGINVSVILTRLGIENKALGFIGGFTGRELERRLKADGISCDFNVLENGTTRINVKIKSREEIDINAEGPLITEADFSKLLNKLDAVKKGDYLILAGSAGNGLSEDIYERIMKRTSDKGVNFVVDASGNLLINALKYKPFLIKPNHHELGALFGAEANTDAKVEEYAKRLQKAGAKNVLVSRSEKGAMLINENGEILKIGTVSGKLLNSVGCGDSMVGGFVAGYLKSGDYSYSLRLGAACGNATAYSEGLAEKAEIERIFNMLKTD